MEQLQNYFGVGRIFKHGPQSQSLLFKVQSTKELKLIINHFDKYPLITQKRADFELFKQAFDLMLNKEHLTIDGLHKILAIKASMNRGLSAELKSAFPDAVAVVRPLVKNQIIENPN